MTDDAPVIFLLHGEDEWAISQEINEIIQTLGEPAMIELNTTRLDGRVVSLDEITTSVSTMPFMGMHRVVILSHPCARVNNTNSQQKMFSTLGKIAPTTVLLLIEDHILTDDRERKKKKLHWLERWGVEAGSRVKVLSFPVPQGQAMIARIQEFARESGGQISPRAAGLLVSLVGDHIPSLQQEVHKLVAYAGFQRTVEEEDVEHLTGDRMQGDIFTLVDSIGNLNGRRSVEMLHKLLDEQDALSIFAMVIRQFRMILQAREILESGGNAGVVARQLKLHPFVSEKVTGQAQRFTMPLLIEIYHRLLDIDVAIKTGEIEDVLALDTFIAGVVRGS
jgi:DNA polymerase III subunit delta